MQIQAHYSLGGCATESVLSILTTERRETRAIERQIRDIERQQQKTTQMLKQNAKKGDKEACRILGLYFNLVLMYLYPSNDCFIIYFSAKELVNSKKAVSRMYQSKAQVNSVMVKTFIFFQQFLILIR